MVAAVASVAAVSCAQELGQVEVPAEASKFTAYAEGAAESKKFYDMTLTSLSLEKFVIHRQHNKHFELLLPDT